MMSNELYITLLYRPFPSELAKRSARSAKTRQSLADHQAQTLVAMEQQGALIERSLREFGPTLLGCYEQGGNLFWEGGELFSFLINGVWRKVRFPTGPAYQALPDARLTFGGGMLEIRQGWISVRSHYPSFLRTAALSRSHFCNRLPLGASTLRRPSRSRCDREGQRAG